MYKLFLFVFVFIASIFYLQSEELKLYLKNLHSVPDLENSYLKPIYVLNFDTLIRRSHLKNVPERMHVVKLPKLQNAIDTSFFYPFFTGWDNSAIQYGVGILLTNHQSDSLSLWVDYNCNLDFTDDKNAFFTITPSNPEIYVDLRNSKNPKATFRYKFKKGIYEDSPAFAKFTNRLSNSNPEQGYLTRDSSFGLNIQGLGFYLVIQSLMGKKYKLA